MRPALVAASSHRRDTPERAALRVEIEARRKHQADIKALQDAVQRATDSYWVSVTAYNKAETVLTEAPDKYADYLAETACGRTPGKPLTIKEAQAALADAEEAKAAARRAKEILEKRLGDANSPFQNDSNKVRIAARAVIASELDAHAIFREVIALQRQLVDKRLKLRWLSANACVPYRDPATDGQQYEGLQNPDADNYLPSLTRAVNSNAPEWWKDVEGHANFENAFNALLEDAMAEVPAF